MKSQLVGKRLKGNSSKMGFYKIVITPRGLKDLKSLPTKIIEQVTLAIDELGQEPRPLGCKKLSGSDDHSYRIKVRKDYRVLYTISDKEKAVHVIRILHRKDAYR